MKAQEKISICVPSYRRPYLVGRCLDSCLLQTHGNFEILIGDDSDDDLTRTLIKETYAADPRVNYVKNEPSLGKARNITNLFARARGDKILLIHDDNVLVKNCIERLLSVWDENPGAEVAFGDQYVTDCDGTVDIARSERLNRRYHRTGNNAGLQKLPGRAGLIQMFPKDGWLAKASLVNRVKYKEQYGTSCDYVFGVELCGVASGVYYLNEYVSYYRKAERSITTRTHGSIGTSTMAAYDYLKGLTLQPEYEPARRLALGRIVPVLVPDYANYDPWRCLTIALENLYAYSYGLNPVLYFHLLKIGWSMLTLRTQFD